MKKALTFLTIVAAFACSLCTTSAAQLRDALRSTLSPSQNSQAEATIQTLCDQAKASYNSIFREYPDDERPDEQNAELAEAEREFFASNCDLVAASFAEYKATGSPETFDDLVRALGEVRYYQSKSPAVVQLTNVLRGQFSLPNLYVEASERFLSAMTRRQVSETFPVQEYIRGAYARGSGVAQGETSLQLFPNNSRAEIGLVLNACISTSVVGTTRGVNVYSDNSGNVTATKRIFVNPNGTFTTTVSSASGRLKSNVNSFNTNRPTPLGGAIIQGKINKELPFTESESSLRVNQRVASQLDEQANAQLYELNQRIERMTLNAVDPMVSHMNTSSSDTRLFFSCVLGRSWQLAAPIDRQLQTSSLIMRSNESAFRRAKTSGLFAGEFVAERPTVISVRSTNASQTNQSFTPVPYAAGPIETILTAPFELVSSLTAPVSRNVATMRPNLPTPARVVKSAVAPTSSASAGPAIPDDGGYDVVVKLHQSGPNNAATVALADAVFGPGADTIDAVIARFPAVDPNDVKNFLTPYEPKEDRPLDPEDNYKDVSIRFDDVRPFVTQFEDGKIITSLHVASCVSDGKEWPPTEVQFVYHVEKRGDSYAFVRETVEVLPEGYQEGDSVSARFHTFRRIFLKRLEKTIQDEYVVVPISLDDPKTGEKRGALIPSYVDVKDGWVVLGFRFDPDYRK
ncbi:MAG: hypothetical protein IK077_08840 [Thermoguttaceae bacterium]|nr:hypothetical protein [Thermoguttaceae bacterium]